MSKIAIKAENISKQYRLGEIGTGTISHDLNRWWHKVRGKDDPFLKIGESNDRSQKGESDYVWSLKDINFEINQGDAVGIIGRNGAGKSTLLKLLSKVTKPTTGQFKVKGRIASLLEVGTGFHPEMTGRENIYLNGAILGMRKPEITRNFDEIVDFAGIERYIDTPVKRYSSGMYVRLAFAVAAHLQSEILIVDEVLAVGDSEFQKKCLGKMGDVSKGEGRTVLFVSHNMYSIKTLCQTGLLLNNGEIQEFGQIRDVLKVYKKFGDINFYFNENTNLNYRINRCSASGRVAGKVRISNFEVTDLDGNIANVFSSKSSLIIKIQYKVFEIASGLNIIFRFESSDIGESTSSNSFLINTGDLLAGYSGELVVKFSNLPLLSGDYVPYIVALSNMNEPYDILDKLVVDIPIISIETPVVGDGNLVEVPYSILKSSQINI